MKIELFLDEDVHSGLSHALRKRGYDAIHAQELERKALQLISSPAHLQNNLTAQQLIYARQASRTK